MNKTEQFGELNSLGKQFGYSIKGVTKQGGAHYTYPHIRGNHNLIIKGNKWSHEHADGTKKEGKGHTSLKKHLESYHGEQYSEQPSEDRAYTEHLKSGGKPFIPRNTV